MFRRSRGQKIEHWMNCAWATHVEETFIHPAVYRASVVVKRVFHRYYPPVGK